MAADPNIPASRDDSIVEPPRQAASQRRGSMSRVALATFIGTSTEWYDFFLYGTAAALVLGPLFFPETSATAATLAAFATIGVGYVARPLGAVVFGHYGDKLGRKKLLYISLLSMGLATALIGVLPGYATLGLAAPIVLVTLRFIQGFAVGGEWGGAVLLAAEHSSARHRGFFACLPQLGSPLGFLLASGILAVLAGTLTGQQFVSWGWRIAFLLSIALAALGLYVRLRIDETPSFKRVQDSGDRARFPLLEVLRRYPKRMTLAIGMNISFGVPTGLVITFSLSYGTTQLGLARGTMLLSAIIASVCVLVTIVVASVMSDRVGRRILCLSSAVLMAVWAFPAFWLIDTARPLLVGLGMSVALAIVGIGYGPMASLLTELFATQVRYSATSVSYAVGAVLGTGLSPLIGLALFTATGSTWPVSLYLVGTSVIGIVSILLVPETRGTDLE